MKHFKEMSQFTGSAFHNKAAKQGSRAVKNREVNEGTAAKVESIKESLGAKNLMETPPSQKMTHLAGLMPLCY